VSRRSYEFQLRLIKRHSIDWSAVLQSLRLNRKSPAAVKPFGTAHHDAGKTCNRVSHHVTELNLIAFAEPLLDAHRVIPFSAMASQSQPSGQPPFSSTCAATFRRAASVSAMHVGQFPSTRDVPHTTHHFVLSMFGLLF
jgi:hypothetical protein